MNLDKYLDPIFLKILTQEADRIAQKARQNASWSSKIPNAIKSGSAYMLDARTYRVEIIVELNEEKGGAPMARAFEYGSGLHDKDDPKLYPIPIRKPGPLHFWWENQQKWFVGPRLPHGHPGVAARPYLKPAIDKPSIKARIANFFKRGLLDAIRVEFKET